MASGYHLIVKKYFEQNRIDDPLPDYIQRGWNRIYTLEEQEFLSRSCIIGPDVQIPNSTVRHRLGTNQILRKAKMEILRQAFELPDELFLNLSAEHQVPEIMEEEELIFQWDEDEDDLQRKRPKSPLGIILDKQREKRRKYEDYKYDYDHLEPLTIEEIVEEIRTNIGKNLKVEDIQLIAELMQIISRNKNDQIMHVYDELTAVQLIDKFGGMPKLVQALQEIQKAFEQVAMKTNVASIETVIDVLLEKDNTYRVAVELLKVFNERTKKTKLQQKFYLIDKSGDISDHDQTVFNMLIEDRISRLPASDLTMLIRDFETIRNIDPSKLNDDRDAQVKFLSEQLNIIFTRAHLGGIKTTFDTMKSPVSTSLREFVEKIEHSLNTKLTEHENILIESYIHDNLASLNENELKIVYERLAQQGTLKRQTDFHESNQSITMGLMRKIETDGLGAVLENMKEAHIDVNSMNELLQTLTLINQHIQTKSPVSLEQMQSQLMMAYFIETRNLSVQNIQELSQAADAYSLARMPLSNGATKEECSTFLEHFQAPFIRKCLQGILNSIHQEKTVDLRQVSSKFYNERVVDLINELLNGSDELNENLLFRQMKKQLKKSKELPDKLYRQMLKEKFIQIDAKVKVDTEKKKVALINKEIKRILNNEKDQIKQKELMQFFDRFDIPLPERVKHWYKNKSNTPDQRSAPPKVKKDMIKQKGSVKEQIKVSQVKTKSIMPANKSERTTQKTKDRLPIFTDTTSAKRDVERRESLPRSRLKTQSTLRSERRHSKSLAIKKKVDDPSVEKEPGRKTKINSQIPTSRQSKDQKKDASDAPVLEPTASFSTTKRTETPRVDNAPNVQVPKEDDITIPNPSSIASRQNAQKIPEDNDILPSKQEQIHQTNNEQSSDGNIEPPQHPSTNVLLAVETKVEKDVDASPKSEEIDTTHFTKDEISSASLETEIFQADSETIRPETTIDGKVGENKVLSFELDQAASYLLSRLPPSSNLEREINIKLSGKTVELLTDLPYEKTKAQRILAKTLPINTSHLHRGGDVIDTSSSSTAPSISTSESISVSTKPRKSSGPTTQPVDESSAKMPSRTVNKSLKETDDYYTKSLTKSLHHLFARSDYDNLKLRKIHQELISSGHISPLNEFYRSKNEALRVTLDHCVTYDQLIQWTLSLLQTNNKPNLIDFGHDLYSIAVELDFASTEHIDNTRCVIEIQENLKHQLQTISENYLREINSYINAGQLEKIVHLPKKLTVTTKDRMISDLNSLLLHLIQACHTFESKYRPMQTRLREIAETFNSRAVADLARKIDELEKHLSTTFSITLFGASQRLKESRFLLIK